MLKVFNFIKISGSKQHRLNFFRNCSSNTIFALSSGHGKCGVAVIRVSGSNSATALKLLTNLKELPKPRTAILSSIKHPRTKEILDKGLILWFPAPRSFTGEDSCELQVHGGIAVVNAILNALGSVPKLRLAEPGEFTRRAFQNAKLDLTEVEGLSDLLQAETEAQRKQAFLQTQGSLSNLYNKWKQILLKAVAHVEAHIDFEETETLELDLIDNVRKEISNLVKEIDKHLQDGRKGETLRNGVKTVILGAPNVGKSSLLNLLCRRPAAIVTPMAGTTRDVLEVTLNIGGYPLILADTAGLRTNTEDVVEIEGIKRAMDNYKNADLIILVVDNETFSKWKEKNKEKTFDDYICDYMKSLNLSDLIDLVDITKPSLKHCIIVLNKTDLGENEVLDNLEDRIIKVSCKTEVGVTDLVNNIAEKLKILCGEPSQEHPSMNQMRHRQHLTDCLRCLQLFLDEISTFNEESSDLVLMAEYLRKSLKHLGKLVGTVTNKQLLDVIFKDFCIGK